MDWGTHVVLAAKLLESCGLDKGGAIYSNLPVIDIKPAHYHRVYAHILENQREILDVALDVLGGKELAVRDFDGLNSRATKVVDALRAKLQAAIAQADRERIERTIYAYLRITEEAPEFVSLAEKARDLLEDDQVGRFSNDKLSACVALVSHLYFDSFNNPVQVFLPMSSLCSAQWAFWDKVDYMRFRGEFYKEENIVPFRKTIAANGAWNVQLKPGALVKAMIIRLGEMGQPAIEYEVVDWGIRRFLRYMGFDDYQRAVEELQFCKSIEKEITDLIIAQFGKPEKI